MLEVYARKSDTGSLGLRCVVVLFYGCCGLLVAKLRIVGGVVWGLSPALPSRRERLGMIPSASALFLTFLSPAFSTSETANSPLLSALFSPLSTGPIISNCKII